MKTKVKAKAKKPTIDDKVRAYAKKEIELLQSVGLKKRLLIVFPKHKGKKPSLLAQFAVAILRSQGGILDTEFSEIKQ